MRKLEIRYKLDGDKKGFNFEEFEGVEEFEESELKQIWHKAMPGGYGWSNDAYIGSKSLKCFSLDNGEVVISELTNTTQIDEAGRQGIRETDITVRTLDQHKDWLRHSLNRFSENTRSEAKAKIKKLRWKLIFRKIFWGWSINIPFLRKSQVIFAFPYSHDKWDLVECCALQLITNFNYLVAKNEEIITFTTLTLNPREEAHIIALPLEIAKKEKIDYISLHDI